MTDRRKAADCEITFGLNALERDAEGRSDLEMVAVCVRQPDSRKITVHPSSHSLSEKPAGLFNAKTCRSDNPRKLPERTHP
jgi:hypothetical protein